MGKTLERIFFRWFSVFLYAIVLTLPVVACAEDDVLRMLVWEGYAPEKNTKVFQKYIEKKYKKKIRIEVSHVSNSDDFFDPVRGKDVDIISPTDHLYNDYRWNLIDNGLILPLNMNNIPNFKNISPALRNAGYFDRGGVKYAVPLTQGPYGLVYNTGFVKKAPESWNVLWAPEYSGKYVLGADVYEHNCMVTALALGYPRKDISNYDALNNKEFKEKLAYLAKNAHSFWDGTDKVDDLFGHMLATSWGFALKGLKEKGEVWRMADPVEGTVYWVDNYSITWALKGKPLLKKIAEEWLNYTLSPEFQVEVIMRDLSCFPITTDIQGRVTDEEKKNFNLDAPEEYQKKRIKEGNIPLRDLNGLEELWKNAMKEREKERIDEK